MEQSLSSQNRWMFTTWVCNECLLNSIHPKLVNCNLIVLLHAFNSFFFQIASPHITLSPKVTDIYLSEDASSTDLICSVASETSALVYWTRNGALLDTTGFYNKETGTLKVSQNLNGDSLFGLYQCFIENKYGMDYSVQRILIKSNFVFHVYSSQLHIFFLFKICRILLVIWKLKFIPMSQISFFHI